jgi:hypothetical protein
VNVIRLSDSLDGSIFVNADEVAAVIQTWTGVPDAPMAHNGHLAKSLRKPPKGPTRVILRSGQPLDVVQTPEAVLARMRGEPDPAPDGKAPLLHLPT